MEVISATKQLIIGNGSFYATALDGSLSEHSLLVNKMNQQTEADLNFFFISTLNLFTIVNKKNNYLCFCFRADAISAAV